MVCPMNAVARNFTI